jgi:gluconate 5-dehydrogenase
VFELNDKKAVVTGGGSGIGKAIATLFAERGAIVHVVDLNEAASAGVVAEIRAQGGQAVGHACDVSRQADVKALMERVGAIDILVNNAATNQRKPLDAFSHAEWRALHAANLDGPFLVTRAVLPGMKARRRGKIVNICSLASDLGRPNIVPYATSKGGLKMLTRALAVELAPYNVQVNGIVPGFFDTDMNAPLVGDAEFSAWVARRVPAGRWAKPPEIAGAAVFLASPAADFVTGHLLHVDGGFAAAY